MRIDHLDYIKLVVADFKKKQQDSERPLLPTFTRAGIRQECLKVYTARLTKRERQEVTTLRNSFGVPGEGEDFTSLIEECPLDDLRPLQNLMNGKIKSPEFANVELLAWLIDFRHRPYSTGMNVLLNEEEVAILNKPKTEPLNSEPSTIEGEESRTGNEAGAETIKGSSGKQSWVKVIAGFLLAIVLGGAYINWNDKTTKQPFYDKVNTGCMYWADDHYEQVPCNEEKEGRLILAMSEEKMKNFKRIMRPDTITERSIGKIYYIKRNNSIEYYTEGGNHPVETTRSLRKLSQYMFDKYLDEKAIIKEDLISSGDPKFINNR